MNIEDIFISIYNKCLIDPGLSLGIKPKRLREYFDARYNKFKD
jgi:hypothetical protein